MESGIDSFSVTTAKEGSAASRPQSQASLQLDSEGLWRHFVCVVPPEFGLAVPVHGNTLEMDVFKKTFKLVTVLQGLKLPDGLSFGEEIPFELGAEQVAHPERILADQPILRVLRNAIRLLQRCLNRQLSQPEFLAELNALGLPVAWRNELANGVFTQPQIDPSKSARSSNSTSEPDAIDALLDSVSTPGFDAKARPSAAERFIAEVGNAGTGFLLEEKATRQFCDGLAELTRDLERGLLDHPKVAGPMGLALALHALVKLMRGPKHLHFHLVPGTLAPEAFAEHWNSVCREHPGQLEGLVCLTPGTPEESPWIANWLGRFGSNSPVVALQLDEKHLSPWLEWVRGAPATVYLFTGGVSAAVGEGHFYFRPAALAYIEALLQNQARLPGALNSSWALSDADVDPLTRSAVDRVYDGASMQALRDRGLNLPVGAKQKAEVHFFPLLPSP